MEVKDEMIVNMDVVPTLNSVKERIESKFCVRLRLGLIANDPDGSRKQWIEFIGFLENEYDVKLAKEYTKSLCNPEGSVMMPYPAGLHTVLTCPPVHDKLERKFEIAAIFTHHNVANIMGSELGVVMASSALDDLSARYRKGQQQSSEESLRLSRQFANKLDSYSNVQEAIRDFSSLPLGCQKIIIEWLEFDDGRGDLRRSPFTGLQYNVTSQNNGPRPKTQGQDCPDSAVNDDMEMDSVDGTMVFPQQRAPPIGGMGVDVPDGVAVFDPAQTNTYSNGSFTNSHDPDQTPVMSMSRLQRTMDYTARNLTNFPNVHSQTGVSVQSSGGEIADSAEKAPMMCSDQNIPMPQHYYSLLTNLSYTEQEIREVIHEKGTHLRVAELIKALSDLRKAKASGQTSTGNNVHVTCSETVFSKGFTSTEPAAMTPSAHTYTGFTSRIDSNFYKGANTDIAMAASSYAGHGQILSGAASNTGSNFAMDINATGSRPTDSSAIISVAMQPEPPFVRRNVADFVTLDSDEDVAPMPQERNRQIGSGDIERLAQHLGQEQFDDNEQEPPSVRRNVTDFVTLDSDEDVAPIPQERNRRIRSGEVERLAQDFGREPFHDDNDELQPKHRKQDPQSQIQAFQLQHRDLETGRGSGQKHKASESPNRKKKTKKKKKLKPKEQQFHAKGGSTHQGNLQNYDYNSDNDDIIHIAEDFEPPPPNLFDNPGKSRAEYTGRNGVEINRGRSASPHQMDISEAKGSSGPRTRWASGDSREVVEAAGKDVPLRCVVIDGSNVAFTHGKKQGQYFFSWPGIQIAVDYFKNRGHTEIMVFAPQHFKSTARSQDPGRDEALWKQLEGSGMLTFTPSRKIQGKRQTCYDDRFIVQYAFEKDGVIVSNDNYRDLMEESEQWRTFIEQRLLMYAFAGDMFMPPNDPFGRGGPTLDQLLKKLDPREMERLMRECQRAQSPQRGVGGWGQKGQRPPRGQDQGQSRATKPPTRQPRSEEKNREFFNELRKVIPDNDAKIQAVLKNHPYDTDLNRLVGHLLDVLN